MRRAKINFWSERLRGGSQICASSKKSRLDEETCPTDGDIDSVMNAIKNGETTSTARCSRTIGRVLETKPGCRYRPRTKADQTARMRLLFMKDLREVQPTFAGDECELADSFFSTKGEEYYKHCVSIDALRADKSKNLLREFLQARDVNGTNPASCVRGNGSAREYFAGAFVDQPEAARNQHAQQLGNETDSIVYGPRPQTSCNRVANPRETNLPRARDLTAHNDGPSQEPSIRGVPNGAPMSAIRHIRGPRRPHDSEAFAGPSRSQTSPGGPNVVAPVLKGSGRSTTWASGPRRPQDIPENREESRQIEEAVRGLVREANREQHRGENREQRRGENREENREQYREENQDDRSMEEAQELRHRRPNERRLWHVILDALPTVFRRLI